MVITIDGPAGSGKSTAAQGLAKALGIGYLDTGATYRAVTLAGLRRQLDLADEAALAKLVQTVDVRLEYHGGQLKVILDGQDVSREIRSSQVSDNAHYVARCPAVRQVLVELQRRIGRRLERDTGGMVTEGRDQGSVVFPDAPFKFYLDASPETRARRRLAELSAAGEKTTYEQVLRGLQERDGRDRGRSLAPLVRPDGADVIDTTDLDVDGMVAELVRRVKAGE